MRTPGLCHRSAGCGVARWTSSGALAATYRGAVGECPTENVAKYNGLIVALRQALEKRRVDSRVVFEMDCRQIVNQVNPYGLNKLACRNPVLQPLFLTCTALGSQLSESGVTWEIRHIYSEYNQVADALARQGAVSGEASWQVDP